MKQRATVQRLSWPAPGLPKVQHLGTSAGGWEWNDCADRAFIFPDFLAPVDCEKGQRCELHAECVARALGGHPVILQRDANEARREEIAAKSAPPAEADKSIAERVSDNRDARKKWPTKPPEDVYSETERHLGERDK